MTESDRKLLTLAIGECWHSDYVDKDGNCYKCGQNVFPVGFFTRRTFTTGNDWEIALEKVVRPNSGAFSDYLWANKPDTFWMKDFFEWFLTLTVEEYCQLVVEFGKERLGWE